MPPGPPSYLLVKVAQVTAAVGDLGVGDLGVVEVAGVASMGRLECLSRTCSKAM